MVYYDQSTYALHLKLLENRAGLGQSPTRNLTRGPLFLPEIDPCKFPVT